MKKLILLMLIVLLVPIALAVNLNDTNIVSNGLNTTINITNPIYVSNLVIDSTYIKFEDMYSDLTTGDSTMDVRVTDTNSIYNESTLPYITKSGDVYTVNNWLHGTTSTVTLDLKHCDVKSIYYSGGLFGKTFAEPGCSPLSVSNLDNNGQTFTVTYYSDEYISLSEPLVYVLSAFGVLVIIICAAIVLTFVLGTGLNDMTSILGTVMALAIGAAILFALVVTILRNFT